MATNCNVVPLGMDGLTGVTEIETSVAVVMVRVVEALTEPDVAVIVATPTALLVARPCVPGELLTATRAALEELQVMILVTFSVLPSVNVPVAVNCFVVPAAVDGLSGLKATDFRAAGVTVMVVLPVIELPASVAVIVAAPEVMALASP